MGRACVARTCCRRAAERAGERAPAFIEPADAPAVFAMPDTTVVAELPAPPAPTLETAIHEAAHAVMALAVGAGVNGASLALNPLADWTCGGIDWRGRVAVSIAGDIAGNWNSRLVARPDDAELQFHIDGIRLMDFGRCDACQAMMIIIANNKFASDEDVMSIYREVETKVISFITRREIFNIITKLARKLLDEIEMSGEDVNNFLAHDIDMLRRVYAETT